MELQGDHLALYQGSRPPASRPLLVLDRNNRLAMNPLRENVPSGDSDSPRPITPNTGGTPKYWDQPVSFPEWGRLLDLEPLESQVRYRHRQAIIRYLRHCKSRQKPASIADAKRYLDEGVAAEELGQTDRDALHWFFTTARQRQSPTGAIAAAALQEEGAPTDVATATPLPIPPDTPAWEERMIRVMRQRGLLWNTEQIYRSWLRRFAEQVGPATPDSAGRDEVCAFLTDLAVRRQVAASTQRQALNALVFFFREVMQRDLGDLGDFQRARRGPKIPVVLSPGGSGPVARAARRDLAVDGRTPVRQRPARHRAG